MSTGVFHACLSLVVSTNESCNGWAIALLTCGYCSGRIGAGQKKARERIAAIKPVNLGPQALVSNDTSMMSHRQPRGLSVACSPGRKALAIVMTGLFLLQVVIPSQVAAANGSVPAHELSPSP